MELSNGTYQNRCKNMCTLVNNLREIMENTPENQLLKSLEFQKTHTKLCTLFFKWEKYRVKNDANITYDKILDGGFNYKRNLAVTIYVCYTVCNRIRRTFYDDLPILKNEIEPFLSKLERNVEYCPIDIKNCLDTLLTCWKTFLKTVQI